MPGGDGTGPAGMGPMTGRAAGFCAGYGMPGYMNPVPGRGFWGRCNGWAQGGGRGRRNWFHATGLTGWPRAGYGYPAFGGGPYAVPEQEVEMLKGQAQYFENALADIKKRIDGLKSKANQA